MGELTREEWLERKNAIDIKIQCHDDEIKRLNTRLIIVEDMHHKELEEQQEKMERLEQLPATRWNSLVSMVLAAIVGGVIAYFFKKI